MKIAVIGSRSAKKIALEMYLPKECKETVSGGASGVDTLAAIYAKENGIKLTEMLPDYARYKRGAPLARNKKIVEYADAVLAFWDGRSRGTAFVIDYCKKCGKPFQVILLSE